MKERLQTLLSSEKIASSKFADILGVNRSSISHLLSGRNNPSLDFLQRVLKKFPHINPDWLLLGQGNMYRNDATNDVHKPSLGLFKEDIKDEEKDSVHIIKEEPKSPKNEDKVLDVYPKQQISEDDRKVKGSDNLLSHGQKQKEIDNKQVDKIVFFYTDKSFEIYYPDKF